MDGQSGADVVIDSTTLSDDVTSGNASAGSGCEVTNVPDVKH